MRRLPRLGPRPGLRELSRSFRHAAAALPPSTSALPLPLPVLIGAAAMFFCGWMLARGANMQKYYFKTQPGRARFGPLQQRALGDAVLVSGLWPRHLPDVWRPPE